MPSNLRYRPKEFSDIIGNKRTKGILESFVINPERPHSYLFYGETGCGKTTFARILANSLGCEKGDLFEFNISNNRGIDTAREIIRHAPIKPMFGKIKVILLDEAHKATSEFQNALLKLLEEPPYHLYFVLCTTEPEKLIKTVRNRCTKFKVNKLTSKGMRRLLENVLKKEKKDLSKDAVEVLIEKADGIPREALILLDEIINITDKKEQIKIITLTEKEKKLGIDLCRELYAKKSWSKISSILSELEDDPEMVRRMVLGYFTKVLLNKDSPHAAYILECFNKPFYDSGFSGLVLACYSCIVT